MKRFISLLLLLVSSCATPPDTSSEMLALVGTTRYQGEPLSSGEVTMLRAEPGGGVFKTAIREDGSFSMDLSPGPYLLLGSGADPETGKKLFAYWTNNPVRLHGNVSDPIVLPFVQSTVPPVILEGEGIEGRILFEGEPVSGAIVAVFLDARGEFHGLPYVESEPTGKGGEFFLNLNPGKYFVLARYRVAGGSYHGPLLKGDLAGFYPFNPITLRTGTGLRLDIPMVKVNRPRGEGSLAHGEGIIVQGRVTTVTGDAANGVRVVLYTIPEMLGRPVFISSPTDAKGFYRLEVSAGGKYFAAARSVIGRPPETGELMGFYDGTEDHSVELEMGDRVTGIDITVKEVW